MSASGSIYFSRVSLRWNQHYFRREKLYSYIITDGGVAAEPPTCVKTFELLFAEFENARTRGKNHKALRIATIAVLALSSLCRASDDGRDFSAVDGSREIVFARRADRRTLNQFIMSFDRTLNGFFPPFAGIDPKSRAVKKLQKELLFCNSPLGEPDRELPPPLNELPALLCHWFAVGSFYWRSLQAAVPPPAVYAALSSNSIADKFLYALSPIIAGFVVQRPPAPSLAYGEAAAAPAPALSGAGGSPLAAALTAAPAVAPAPVRSGAGGPSPVATPTVGLSAASAPALSDAGEPPPAISLPVQEETSLDPAVIYKE